LFLAVREGNLRAVLRLIAKGVDMQTKDYRGFTPLHVAASRPKVEILWAILCKSSHLVDLPGPGGNTALHLACILGHSINFAVLRSLADLEARNEEGETPLLSAVRGCGLPSSSSSSPTIVSTLLIEAVNINVRNRRDQTALDILAL